MEAATDGLRLRKRPSLDESGAEEGIAPPSSEVVAHPGSTVISSSISNEAAISDGADFLKPWSSVSGAESVRAGDGAAAKQELTVGDVERGETASARRVGKKGVCSSTVECSSSTRLIDLADDLPPPAETAAAPVAATGTPATPAQSSPPTAILDGTKLILAVNSAGSVSMDGSCRVLTMTRGVRAVRRSAGVVTFLCGPSEDAVAPPVDTGIIVVDCNSSQVGGRFIPIDLEEFGSIYTKDVLGHVWSGQQTTRVQVHSRNLPYRTCNKFTSHRVHTAGACGSAGDYNRLELLVPSVSRSTRDSTGSNMLFLRADESAVQLALGPTDILQFEGGKPIAWTLGLRFELTDLCCFRFVTAVHGPGVVWVQGRNTGGGRSFVA